jgi:hypothetical protein
MTPRPRAHDGDPAGSGPSRPHGTGGGSARADEAIASAVARAGRAGNGPASTPHDIANGQPQHLVTHPTGSVGGTPTGFPVRISRRVKVDDQTDNRRSAERENATAAYLADRGYVIHQRPTKPEVAAARLATGDTGDPLKDPDYLLEGRVFDCYSPTPDKPIRGVWFQTGDKAAKEQTQRVVVDLLHWRGDLDALQKQFNDWPIEDLKEVKAILPSGEIVQLRLPWAERLRAETWRLNTT